MKTFFYAFISLFTATFACAQGAVNYVSFFPPNNVIHSYVILEQDLDPDSGKSFDPYSVKNRGISDNNVYITKQGGMILNAANNSTTKVENLLVRLPAGKKFMIPDFKVDNIIRVSALGQIQNIDIGSVCDESSCTETFISANNVALPLTTEYPQYTKFIVRVANKFTSNVWIYSNNFRNFVPHFVPLNGVTSLTWVKLRIKGTEECRWYLVQNKPSNTTNALGVGPCAEPNENAAQS